MSTSDQTQCTCVFVGLKKGVERTHAIISEVIQKMKDAVTREFGQLVVLHNYFVSWRAYVTATEFVMCSHKNYCSFLDYWTASQNTYWKKRSQAIERYCPGSINERETRSSHIWDTETLWSQLPWCLDACLRLQYYFSCAELNTL